MKYTIEGNNDYNGDVLKTILERRGIEDVDSFLKLDETTLEPIERYNGIQEGYELLLHHINKGSSIHLIVDPDVDGLTSSAKMILYLRDLEKVLNTKINITYHHN